MIRFTQWPLGLVFIAACGGGGPAGTTIVPPPPPPPPLAQTVTTARPLEGVFLFQPASVTIAAGGTVTWTVSADAPAGVLHSVTSDTDAWTADTLGANESLRLTFPTAGRFPYRCVFHAGMSGAIVVK